MPEEPDFEKVMEDSEVLILLGSALKTGIFQSLTEEKDLDTLTVDLKADKRALYIVLEALCRTGYLERKNEKYLITARARMLFIEQGEHYLGGYLPHFMNRMKSWLDLSLIIKGEKGGRKRPDSVSAFMNAMASRPDALVEDVIEECLKRKADAKKVLDLGGGPGKYAKAFINRGLEAVLFDTPETIDYVGREFGLSDTRELTLKKGDFTNDDFIAEFEKASFDIVFMGHVTHIYSEEENRALFLRIWKLIKRGGMAVIEDFVRGRSPYAEMFAVNMLAGTERGGTWTESQYREWLTDAGFCDIEVADLDGDEKQLITAFKK